MSYAEDMCPICWTIGCDCSDKDLADHYKKESKRINKNKKGIKGE